MKLSQAKAIAKAAITVKTDTLDCVPYLVSGAGIGKTTVVHEIANELGIEQPEKLWTTMRRDEYIQVMGDLMILALQTDSVFASE